jgi:hypothetical protein
MKRLGYLPVTKPADGRDRDTTLPYSLGSGSKSSGNLKMKSLPRFKVISLRSGKKYGGP